MPLPESMGDAPKQHTPKSLGKVMLGVNVYDAALARIRHCFDMYDYVLVSFSGGKDSTVVLNLVLLVAAERGRLPVDVVFWDEEAVAPETIEYVERVRADPRVRLRWMAIPVLHRNGCSRTEPIWRPWELAKRDVWVRDLPPHAETHLPGFTGQTIPEAAHLLFDARKGTGCLMTGIRADESLRRYQSVMNNAVDNYIAFHQPKGGGCSYAFVKPIYDWRNDDVWIAPHRFGWDYNRAYDKMQMMGMSRPQQRVAPPFGEEPMSNLYMYQICWPELWDKMIGRVSGAATAARYARTELYGHGKKKPAEGEDWQTSIQRYLLRYDPGVAANVARVLQGYIEVHRKRTIDPIPNDVAHPVTGVSWAKLAAVALRGDAKRRKRPVSKLGYEEVVASRQYVESGVARSVKDAMRQRAKFGHVITTDLVDKAVAARTQKALDNATAAADLAYDMDLSDLELPELTTDDFADTEIISADA